MIFQLLFLISTKENNNTPVAALQEGPQPLTLICDTQTSNMGHFKYWKMSHYEKEKSH